MSLAEYILYIESTAHSDGARGCLPHLAMSSSSLFPEADILPRWLRLEDRWDQESVSEQQVVTARSKCMILCQTPHSCMWIFAPNPVAMMAIMMATTSIVSILARNNQTQSWDTCIETLFATNSFVETDSTVPAKKKYWQYGNRTNCAKSCRELWCRRLRWINEVTHFFLKRTTR
jgi:hypothetical protein